MDAAEPRLMQAFLECRNFDSLDKPSKAALRLCNKQIKTCIDATINSCRVQPPDLHALLGRDWNLTKLNIGFNRDNIEALPKSFTSLLQKVVEKFPLLVTFAIEEVAAALPENIGKLAHLKNIILAIYSDFRDFSASFGQLIAVERLELTYYEDARNLRELEPLKHLVN